MTPPALVGATVGRMWRAYADATRAIRRSGSRTPPLDVLGRPTRRDVGTWNARTAGRHEEYRLAVAPLEGPVAVVCVSQRPELLGDVVDNVRRQVDVDVEFVFVANATDFDDELESVVGGLDGHVTRAVALRAAPDRSLGACLNLGMRSTDARFVAKFDDDDRYGEHYLVDALRAHRYAGAGVVGKHTYYAEMLDTEETVLRFPCHEFIYSGTLAGGTLVIDRERTGDLQFDEISLGEDRAFVRACHRRGVSTFSADRFNFLQRRGELNTWVVDRDVFLRGTMEIDVDDPQHRIDR